MKNPTLIIGLLLTITFTSCERAYVCDCDSSSGIVQTTVGATNKRKAKKGCEDLSYQTPTNDNVQVYECYLK